MRNPFSIQTKDEDLKDTRVDNFSYRQDEGSYLPGKEPEKAVLAHPIKKGRLYFLFFLIVFLIFVIFSRLFWLQIVKGEEYRNLAEGNRFRTLAIKADRGLIYDQNLKSLVKNKPYFSLIVVPADLPKDEEERKEIKEKLFSFLEKENYFKDDLIKSKEKINNIFNELDFSSYQEKELISRLDYQTALKLKLELVDWPGFLLRIRAQRDYLTGDLTSHFLGYVGKLSPQEVKERPNYLINDFIGKTGLELFYEKELKGEDGEKKIEVNSLGKEKRVVSSVSAKTGNDLVLFLDLELQKKITEILKKYIRIGNGKAGTIIVLNPNNGGILAISSLPSYDNNSFIDGNPEKYLNDPVNPLIFRAISGEYPSGSVIKPIIAAGALMEEIIDKKTSFLSQGGIRIKEWFYPDWKAGGHGWTDLIKALAESVNTFFYYIGGGHGDFEGLGPNKMNYYAQLFGLTKPTGIDLFNEQNGLFATPEWKEKYKKEQWYVGDTYHLSIGQGDILVTPLQVANYTAVFANRGTLYQPRLVNYFKNIETGDKKYLEKEIIRENFIEKEYLDLINQGLKAAVEWGSAQRLSSLPIEVAGKTGTAQNIQGSKPHAWFTGFAPYQDPEIVVTVLIENGGGGDEIAVPAAQEVFKYYFSEE